MKIYPMDTSSITRDQPLNISTIMYCILLTLILLTVNLRDIRTDGDIAVHVTEHSGKRGAWIALKVDSIKFSN